MVIIKEFGFVFLVDTDFLRHFKPIDMGFEEHVVDDLDTLISTKCFMTIITDINESINYGRSATVKSFLILILKTKM